MNATRTKALRLSVAASLALLLALLATVAPLSAQNEPPQEQPAPCPSPTAPCDRIFFGDYGVNGCLESIDEFGNVEFTKYGGSKIDTDITAIKFLRLNKNADIPANHIRMGYIFKLADNTRFTGNIVAWDGDAITVQSEYAGKVRINRSAVRYIYTCYNGNIGKPWHLPNKNAIILRGQTEPIPFDVITPEFCEPQNYPRQISAFKIRVGDDAPRTIPIAKIAGVVFATRGAAKTKPVVGWYAFVTTANFDRLPGVVEKLDGEKLQLTTGAMGVLKIDRCYVEYVVFSETPQTQRGHVLLSDQSVCEVVEYDREMNVVWAQNIGHTAYHVTRLENGNILVSIPQQNAVFEINPQRFDESTASVPVPKNPADEKMLVPPVKAKIRRYKVVWRAKVGLSHPVCATRLPNGNTLIADQLNHRVLELDADGYRIGEYFVDECAPTYVTQLPNGNLLVCSIRGMVFEGARDGRIVRSWKVSRPNFAAPLPDGRIVVVDISGTRAIYMIGKNSDKAVRTKHIPVYGRRISITDQGNLAYYISVSRIPAIVFYTPDGKRLKCWRAPATLTNVYMTEVD